MTHVVLIAHARHPVREPFAGGLESLTARLAGRLRDRGVQVTVFAGPGSEMTPPAQIMTVRELQLGAAARRDVSMPEEEHLRQHHAYLQVMVELGRRADVDVVHNNSLHYLPIAMATTVPAPMLTTLHTPPTPWLEPAIGLMDTSRARFVAVSVFTARSWSHVVASRVIRNGVDVDQWQPGPGGPDLVWCGRIVPEKAPHLAILVARAAGRRIQLAGPLSDRAYFDARVAPLLGEDARYAGHLDTAQLVALVGSSAAMLVTPVWDEPYGLVAAESLACGTPVLGFARGGLPEVVDDSCARLVQCDASGDANPENADPENAAAGLAAEAAAVQAAAALVEDVVRLDRGAARERAVTACSLDTMVDDYLQMYAEMAPEPAFA